MISFCQYLILSVVVTTIWSIILKLLRVKYVYPPLAFFMWIFIIPVICLQLISNHLMQFSDELVGHLIHIIPQKVKEVKNVKDIENNSEIQNESEMSELPK